MIHEYTDMGQNIKLFILKNFNLENLTFKQNSMKKKIINITQNYQTTYQEQNQGYCH